MKNLLLLLLLFCSAGAKAQDGQYFNFGWCLTTGSHSGLNKLVDNYNTTRPWLSHKMNEFHFMHGAVFGFGLLGSHYIFDVQFVMRHRTESASGIDATGINGNRDIKYRLNTLNIGLGTGGPVSNNMQLYLGLSFDGGLSRLFTRAWYDGDPKPKYESLDDLNASLGSTLFLDLRKSNSAFCIRPFFQFYFLNHHFFDSNTTINNFVSDDSDLSSKPWNLGVQILVGLGEI